MDVLHQSYVSNQESHAPYIQRLYRYRESYSHSAMQVEGSSRYAFLASGSHACRFYLFQVVFPSPLAYKLTYGKFKVRYHVCKKTCSN